MKIEYTYTDARVIEDYFHKVMKSNLNPTKKKGWAAGFQTALELCGVKFIRDYMRTYAPDGNEFPQEQIDAYRKQMEAAKAA